MTSFITHFTGKLIKNLILFGLTLPLLCTAPIAKDNIRTPHTFLTKKGHEIRLRIAKTDKEKTQGLSGIQSNQFKEDEGMFFYYKKKNFRQFWMPDTYFDLDIIFLDENLKIVHIDRKVKAHPGRSQNPPIARTKTVYCRYVLEIKSDSPLSREVQVGNVLRWKSSSSILEIESDTRP
jgi:uncharacterized membrane protein (UPF0127 family)